MSNVVLEPEQRGKVSLPPGGVLHPESQEALALMDQLVLNESKVFISIFRHP